MSYRFYVKSCLDTARRLFLSCRGHGLGHLSIQWSRPCGSGFAVVLVPGVGERFSPNKPVPMQHLPVQFSFVAVRGSPMRLVLAEACTN